MEGGRFDFTDGGSYVGEWCDGRAHGLGIATGPENQGEYSGEWNMGFQTQGVYIWPNGKIYSGTWLQAKRHGEGILVKGRWIYRGAFTTGFCGRYGVRESLESCAKYEGSWHLNQCDGFGVETNSDGSIYAGAWSRGMRQGLGVRRSAPYEQAAEFNRAVRPAQSQNSIPSGTDSERGWKGTGSLAGCSGNTGTERGRSDERRSGFVLRAFSSPSQSAPGTISRSTSAQRSATPNPEKRSLFQRGIFRKLRKQRSTGDLSLIGGIGNSEFSSTSGCGGGSLFHGRSRRAGGSLRSTFSGSSHLVNSSFGRGDKRAIVNGGNGFHEPIEEPMGANVTETYSGQWNEDRRAGYGVAERSDGLRYAGEWFNNKKDGYGVTYHVNGTKEEGRYKENILIQALNRRSKFFLLRHTKIRDAIEEAVRNAEELAKQANENAAKSAYQRAQTAQMFASTADAKAREARRMSEEARCIARDFSPDFLQPGVEWETQNPLLKNTLLGQNYAEQTASPKPNDRQFQRVNHNTNHSLEVTGGSRHGSFRSSFRRSKQANASDLAPRPNQLQDGERYMDEHGKHHNEFHGTQRHHHPNVEPPQLQQTRQAHESYSPPLQRTPGGRPMSRAATTGVSGVVPPGADQRQIAHHMAQHPHSPYLMSSVSQNLDDLDMRQQHESLRQSRARHEPAQLGQDRSHATGRVTMGRGQLSHAQEHRAHEVAVFTSQLVPASPTYQAHVEVVEEDLGRLPPNRRTVQQQRAPREAQRTQAHVDHKERIPGQEVQTVGGGRHAEKYNTLQEEYDRTLETTHPRRRTLPSIISDPLLTAKNVSKMKLAPVPSRLVHDALNESILDEDAIHSAEHLNSQAASSYIIENGIRKRVRAVQQEHYQRPEGVHQQSPELCQKSFNDGRRPEWTTTYDPYRPAMESTLRLPTTVQAYGHTEQTYEPAELTRLPHTYRIESTLSLLNPLASGGGRTKEGSAPDIPRACALSGTGARTLYSSGLTHQELEQLTSARKLELMEEMKRRKRGEIVIRLADIKDWLRANFVIVFVILVNAILAFLFFMLITGSSITLDSTTPGQPEAAPIGRSTTGSTVVKVAKKVLKSTLKSSKSKPTQPDVVA